MYRFHFIKNHFFLFFFISTFPLLFTFCDQEGEADSELDNTKKQLLELKNQKSKIEQQIDELTKKVESMSNSTPMVSNEDLRVVSAKKIKPQTFKHYIDILGKIDDNNILVVTPKTVPGIVKEIYVKPKQKVKKGDLLLKLDDTIVNTQIKTLENQIAFLKNIYDKQKKLWEENIGSEIQLLTSKNNYESALNNLVSLNANKGLFMIKAEAGGVVDMINVEVGEMFTGVSRSGNQLTIKTNNKTKIIASIPDNYYNRIKVGYSVLIEIPNSNNYLISKISSVSNNINISSRTFDVDILLKSKSKTFFANQSVLVKILDYVNSDCYTISLNLLRSDLKGNYIYVLEKNAKKNNFIAKKKYIKTGQIYDGKMEVLEGIKSGDIVVTKGYEELYDGINVNADLKS